jgi:hypothetical protein
MMPISVPKKFTVDEIDRAVTAIKVERPDLWKAMLRGESSGEGYAQFDVDILRILHAHFPELDTSQAISLKFRVRQVVRREVGLPV